MNKLLILFCFAIFCGYAFAEQYPNLPLDKILTKDEQKPIGLSKPNDTEKENLRIVIIEKYLAGYEQGKKEGIKQAAEYIIKQQTAPSSDVIESRIDGDFEGWEGKTIVELMNGQTWQQTEQYYNYH